MNWPKDYWKIILPKHDKTLPSNGRKSISWDEISGVLEDIWDPFTRYIILDWNGETRKIEFKYELSCFFQDLFCFYEWLINTNSIEIDLDLNTDSFNFSLLAVDLGNSIKLTSINKGSEYIPNKDTIFSPKSPIIVSKNYLRSDFKSLFILIKMDLEHNGLYFDEFSKIEL